MRNLIELIKGLFLSRADTDAPPEAALAAKIRVDSGKPQIIHGLRSSVKAAFDQAQWMDQDATSDRSLCRMARAIIPACQCDEDIVAIVAFIV
jgi:hypothetical protein